ncbi:MAG: aspartate/glutamate racemase family protein [Acetobacteraceae bacterium]|nr:aspartate/glutamate racemase family protein [Acetobacteraceae bacterium]
MPGNAVPRILLVNPNSSTACSAGIDAAVAGLRHPGGPMIEVATVADGPPGIYSWRDWHAAVAPLCAVVAGEAADVFVIACASDPGIEAVREVTGRPVLGMFRCAVAAAMLRAERFGVIALADASVGRHALALRAMGVQGRLAGEIAMNTSIDALLDPVATGGALLAAGRGLVAQGAGAVVLGCTGMAGHRAALAAALGVPVIEPCQAAAAQALGLLAGGAEPAARDGRAAG